jgi:aminoglycoside phosphotransferase (APT) family kinase protein
MSARDGDGFEAVKVSHMTSFPESEAYMLQYAVEHAGVKAPKLRRVEIVGDARLMVTDFVPGVPLDTVWSTLNETDRAGIKQQLQEQIALFRNCSIPYIGRIGDDATFPDPYRPFRGYFIGPFQDESAFDDHKVQEFEKRANGHNAKILKTHLDALRGTYSKRFVLTHVDLNSRNIHVERKDGSWQISGILDWERSGFFPEYMEYAVAMTTVSHNQEWRQVLKEVLEGIGIGCSEERVNLENVATERLF